MAKETSIASVIGSILAIIQSIFDDLFGFLARKLKSAGNTKRKKSDSDFVRFLKEVARFFGELGDSFYSTYEKIKKDKKP